MFPLNSAETAMQKLGGDGYAMEWYINEQNTRGFANFRTEAIAQSEQAQTDRRFIDPLPGQSILNPMSPRSCSDISRPSVHAPTISLPGASTPSFTAIVEIKSTRRVE